MPITQDRIIALLDAGHDLITKIRQIEEIAQRALSNPEIQLEALHLIAQTRPSIATLETYADEKARFSPTRRKRNEQNRLAMEKVRGRIPNQQIIKDLSTTSQVPAMFNNLSLETRLRIEREADEAIQKANQAQQTTNPQPENPQPLPDLSSSWELDDDLKNWNPEPTLTQEDQDDELPMSNIPRKES